MHWLNFAFYKLRDHFLTRHKIIMMKMTDISFISHTPEPLKGSKSARDECILSGLIWIQTVCKCYQQMKLGGNELKTLAKI